MHLNRLSCLALLAILLYGCTVFPGTRVDQITPNPTSNTAASAQPTVFSTAHTWPTATSAPLYAEWAEESIQWLKTIPCSAPCWSGITPGKTTVSEAIRLLKKTSIVDPGTVKIVRELCGSKDGAEISNTRRITWKWAIPDSSFDSGSIYYSQQDPPEAKPCGVDFQIVETITPDSSTNSAIVIRIELDFPGPTHQNPNFLLQPNLSSVIQAYGKPTYIIAVYDPAFSWYTLTLIYETQGFSLSRQAREKLDIDGNLSFEELIFSTNPVQDGLHRYKNNVLNIWQGMKSFDFYCHFENGEPCK